MTKISLNKSALPIVKYMIKEADEIGIFVHETKNGATIIDCGMEVPGGFEAGKCVTEVTLGGIGQAKVTFMDFGEFVLPAMHVTTDHPALATMGSQMGGWRIPKEVAKNLLGLGMAIGSGPARALAKTPAEVFDSLKHEEKADVAILVIQCDKFPMSKFPTESIVTHVSKETGIDMKRVYILIVPTNCLAGNIQIAGRCVENGVYTLFYMDYDITKLKSGAGIAPIAPVHPNSTVGMGMANDLMMYGLRTFYTIETQEEEDVCKLAKEMVIENRSPDYGKLYGELYEQAGKNFYKVDFGNYAPSEVTLNDLRTGTLCRAGRLRADIIKKSLVQGSSYSVL
ncbi:methenyltetrahydromethanopterin cyclohydrolase [Candidatus Bathyarchaeota archaeon]|nr:methenyltetrahydromethanopterin cyclohydrolase [Candidatus Bathyarchaeota archaeon]